MKDVVQIGCGCGKKSTLITQPSGASARVEPNIYDVFNTEGALVASSTNPVLARVEARRSGGTVVLRAKSTSASPA